VEETKLSALEKTALVEGWHTYQTHAIVEKGIASIFMTDGPHGLRKAKSSKSGQNTGVKDAEPSTAYPTAAALASSWDKDLASLEGKGVAEECLHYGVDVILGPGACLKRNPLCGRNFEYFSEDPLLSGEMAASWIKGVQGKGVGACLKHYLANNEENFRNMSDSIIDPRALHELYLRNFEIAVKEGKPACVMASYNAVNGVYLSENKALLQGILRKEWGFDGLVMTDWGGTHSRVKGIEAGVDLDMPGEVKANRNELMEELAKNPSFSAPLDTAVSHVLALGERFKGLSFDSPLELEKHAQDALRIAIESAVLLKNEEGILPLKNDEKVLIIGPFFKTMRYQGAGSSFLCPAILKSPEIAFHEHSASFDYVEGFGLYDSEHDGFLLEEALHKAQSYETLVLFLGLDDFTEMEGKDRDSLSLPKNQLALVKALAGLGKKIVVVYFGGSAVEIPFAKEIEAFLAMYLPGEMGGEACYRLLYGLENPSGKLAESWPISYSSVPFEESFSRGREEYYREGIFVGYRYYLSHPEFVRFPFGHGLSYTSFVYSDLETSVNGDVLSVSFALKNSGTRSGKEISQLYIGKKDSATYRPLYELRGFRKTELRAGEATRLVIVVPLSSLRYFETSEKRFILEDGAYEIYVGSSSTDIRLEGAITLKGEKASFPLLAPSYLAKDFAHYEESEFLSLYAEPFPAAFKESGCSLETRFADYHGFLGTIIKKAILSVPGKERKKALKMSDGERKTALLKDACFVKNILLNNCARSLYESSGGALQHNVALGMAYFGAGRFFKGLHWFLKKEINLPFPEDGGKGR